MSQFVKSLFVGLVATGIGTPALALATFKLSGNLKFPDGEPVRAATVLLLDGTPARSPGELPPFQPIDMSISDKDGNFSFVISGSHTALIVELVRDRCDWLGKREIIAEEILRQRKSTHLPLVVRRDECPAP